MEKQGPKLLRPSRVIGHRLEFRDAGVDDAQFILSLRLNQRKNRFLSTTTPDLGAQVEWLRHYGTDDSQTYFVIADRSGRPVGTVRLYDVRGDSFGWGSWILSDSAPPSSAVESTLMVYHFGLACGFTHSHFEVRKGNEKVWRYHERFGAARVAEDDLNFYYQIDGAGIRRALERYSGRLPGGVKIEFD